MRLPLIHPPTQLNIYVIGDVVIHEGAVIAPGTILQAEPNSRILIREGVCIGMGNIINAYQGDIEIQSGAILGAGVLVIGQSKIGKNTCIGSLTTIINTSIERGTTIKAGSLIGDTSRSFSAEMSEPLQETESETNDFYPDKNDLISDASIMEIQLGSNRFVGNGSISNRNDSSPNPQLTEKKKTELLAKLEDMEDIFLRRTTEVDETPKISKQPNLPPDLQTENLNSSVVGLIHINKLLCTLFPERRSFNRPQQD